MKLTKAVIVASFLSAFITRGHAQDILAGKIIDEKSGAPLSYASISLKGKGVGTVCNSDGEFEFCIPEGHLGDTLLISMLGYGISEKALSTINRSEPIIVELKESPIQLKEVVVVANSISPNDIFKKAFENLDKTFPQGNYLLKAFYRQINTENGKNVFLVEASVNIFDNKTQLNKGFKLREKVFVNQVRFSNSFFKNTDPNYFESSNTLTWLLLFNYTKYRNKYIMERTNFVLDSVISYNQRSFYVISSTVRSNALTNKFTLYIDAENFSFLKIKNETVANKGNYLQNFDVFTDAEKTKVFKLVASSQIYQFEKFLDRMYLKHAHSYSRGEIINIKTSAVEWNVTDENLLVITEVTAQDVKTPSSGLLMNNGKNIKFLSKKYDPKFWNSYKLVNLIPLTQRQQSDLQQRTPLEEQFQSQITKK